MGLDTCLVDRHVHQRRGYRERQRSIMIHTCLLKVKVGLSMNMFLKEHSSNFQNTLDQKQQKWGGGGGSMKYVIETGNIKPPASGCTQA